MNPYTKINWILGVVTIIAALVTSVAAQTMPTPQMVKVRVALSVDEQSTNPSFAFATIEPALTPHGYSWVRAYFFDTPTPKDSHQWRAVLQLTVDKDFKISQVDMAIPGHTCTVAWTPEELKVFGGNYKFDGKRLEITTKGMHRCELIQQTFRWDVDAAIPVIESHEPAKAFSLLKAFCASDSAGSCVLFCAKSRAVSDISTSVNMNRSIFIILRYKFR